MSENSNVVTVLPAGYDLTVFMIQLVTPLVIRATAEQSRLHIFKKKTTVRSGDFENQRLPLESCLPSRLF